MDYIDNVELKIVKSDYANGNFNKHKPWEYPGFPAPSEIKGDEAIYRGMKNIDSLFKFMFKTGMRTYETNHLPQLDFLEKNLRHKYFEQGIPGEVILFFDNDKEKYMIELTGVFGTIYPHDDFIENRFSNYSITLSYLGIEKTFDVSNNETNEDKIIIIPDNIADELFSETIENVQKVMIIIKGIKSQ